MGKWLNLCQLPVDVFKQTCDPDDARNKDESIGSIPREVETTGDQRDQNV